MDKKPFFKTGHTPTLLAAFLYFDISFMAWVLLGPLGVQIAADLNLSAAQKGLMVAAPMLSGAFLRIVMGILIDHIKPKRTGAIAQIIVMSVMFSVWQLGVHSFEQVLVVGALLGMAGAAFAVSLPLASRWYPPEHQGTALGLAGAGNSGAITAALFGPTLAIHYGWTNVFGFVLIPMSIIFVIYLLIAKDAPENPPPKQLADYLKVLKDRDAWWFMFFYAITFGGFSGLANSLTIYFDSQYGMGATTAGFFTAACVSIGCIGRPFGGFVADRVGGIKSVSVVYIVGATGLTALSFGPASPWVASFILVFAMLAFGMGNGAMFQLIPQRFRKEIGVMTGLVGMAGCLGGFFLASGLGYSRHVSGSYQNGLLIFAGLAVVALIGLTGVKTRWRTTWGASHLTSAKI